MGGSSKEQTIGYKYFLGLHAVFHLGHADAVYRLEWDEKQAWVGENTGGTFSVSAETLFGNDVEGGVKGTIDFEKGLPTQLQNAYLLNLLGEYMPAFRGVTALIFRGTSSGGFYWGNNPYLKPFAARFQRIHISTDGLTQWYDEKAAVPVPDTTGIGTDFLIEDFSEGLAPYTITQGPDMAAFTIVGTPYGNGMKILTTVAEQEYGIERELPPSTPLAVSFKCKLDGEGPDDNGRIYFLTPTGTQIFQFNICRDGTFDADRRAQLNPPFAGNGEYMSSNNLVHGEWHTFVANLDWDTDTISATLHDSDGTLIGSATDSLPPGSTLGGLRFVIDANSIGSGSTFADISVSYPFVTGDMNPSHIIRECLTDTDWGMGYNPADIDDASFTAAADTLFTEGMGISLPWDKQMIIEDFIKEIIKHINAVLYVDRETGLFTLDLLRDDYDIEDLLVLDESNIDRVADFTRPVFGELCTSVTANYWDSKTGKDASKTLSDDALAAMQQAEINTTIQYQGFTNSGIIDRVLQRDLKTLSSPLISCTIYAKRVASSLKIGKCFVWNWEDYEIEGAVMRVTGIAYGDGKLNRVRLTCTQDIYAQPTEVFTPPTPPIWEDPVNGVTPTALTNRLAVEVPYYEMLQREGATVVNDAIAANPDLGYVGIAAGANSVELNAVVLVDAGAGYENVGNLDFSPIATLNQTLDDKEEATFDIENVSDIEEIQIGTVFQLNDELMEVEAITAASITAKRAVLDTVPGEHAEGDKLYFWDRFLSISPTEYIESDSVDIKLLPTIGGQQLAEGDAPVDTVVVAGRASKPYPPGRFKVNGSYYPSAVAPAGAFAVTWVHRDRVAQADQLVGTFEAGIGPEAKTRYALRFLRADTLALLVEKLDIDALTADVILFYTGDVICQLYSITDNGESWQRHEHTFAYTMPVGTLVSSIAATSYVPADHVTIIHGGIVTP